MASTSPSRGREGMRERVRNKRADRGERKHIVGQHLTPAGELSMNPPSKKKRLLYGVSQQCCFCSLFLWTLCCYFQNDKAKLKPHSIYNIYLMVIWRGDASYLWEDQSYQLVLGRHSGHPSGICPNCHIPHISSTVWTSDCPPGTCREGKQYFRSDKARWDTANEIVQGSCKLLLRKLKLLYFFFTREMVIIETLQQVRATLLSVL